MSFTSPTEYVSACHLLDTNVTSAFPGIFVPFATGTHGVHKLTGLPSPDFVPPTAFLTLSTGYSSTRLVDLFHPTATSGIRSSGVFPATQLLRLIDAPCPLAVKRASSASNRSFRRRIHPPRLQGFDPDSDPLTSVGGLGLPTTRSPLGLSTPAGFPRTPWKRLRVPSTPDLFCPALAVHKTAGLQRIDECPTLLIYP
jgi:hypothetical protein